ncbi:MAG: beta-ketoacyl-[acyl-carrier-protein] synthase family protein [Ruminococcus flavefaciens]|nr:beta-ketoacyl-[acyl-carrier-protein] synthase family protein [Ruminococcus flavefaciens]MCM1232616.1 beta-ketoacyl-[acyl-carrier-protein] synthase family protein [Ruminococcus flavefaciens]
MRNVVVTGLGAVTAIGETVPKYWENLIAGKSGMRTITRISTEEHDTTVAAEVDDDFEALVKKHFKKRQLNPTTRTVRMGLASACEAIEDCGIDIEAYDKSRVSVIYGIIDSSFRDAETESKMHLTLKEMPSLLPAMLEIKYGFRGASFNLSTACASSAYAIALGKMFVESGASDLVVVGGVGQSVSHSTLKGFNQIMAMSANPDPETACRSFTKNRDGFIMGEGAGTIILESEESALKRNAKIYCRLLGASMCGEASDLTAPAPDGEGMLYSMKLAVENAGIGADEIDYINAHGTSTSLNDKYETTAIRNFFGERASEIPVSSIKPSIGHTLAAGGVLEAIATIKAIETGIIPPTVHFDEADPELNLDFVPNTARKKNISTALSNSFGFGGHNSTLVFGKY